MLLNISALGCWIGMLLIVLGIIVMIYEDDLHKIKGPLIALVGALMIAANYYFIAIGNVVLWNI